MKLQDDYEEIQKAVFDSIIRTKWSGTVNLDFSNLRKQGASIRNGKRISNGVKPYVEMLNSLIKTQGREKNDLPISVSLPIHHYELFNLLSSEKWKTKNTKRSTKIFSQFSSRELKAVDNSLVQVNEKIKEEDLDIQEEKQLLKLHEGLNRNIIISDLFMWRVFEEKENAQWYFMDNDYFKSLNLNLDKEEDYLKAEQLILEKKVPSDVYKSKNAKLTFNELLEHTKENNINLIFPEFYLQQNTFTNKNLIFGKNGQNAIKEKGKQFYLNFGLNLSNSYMVSQFNSELNVLDSKRLKDNLTVLIYICSLMFKKNYSFINVLGLNDLANMFYRNKVVPEQEIKKAKQNILFKLFTLIQQAKELNKNFDLKVNGKAEFLDDQPINDFVHKFNEKRKGLQYLKQVQEDVNKQIVFNHWFLDDLFCLNHDVEQSYVCNVEENHIGMKDVIVEVIENGLIRKVPSPTFLIQYNRNSADLEVYNKIFMKRSYSYFSKNPILNDFFPSYAKLKEEFEFFSHFIPFFRQGVTVSISRKLDKNEIGRIVLECWLNGFTNISIH